MENALNLDTVKLAENKKRNCDPGSDTASERV